MLVLFVLAGLPVCAQSQAERNKLQASHFLRDVWFAGKAEDAVKYVAPEVIVNDARRGLGLRENPKTQQQQVWRWCVERGDCAASEVVSQVAEGDLVATYWIVRWSPKRFWEGLLAGALGKSSVERRAMSVFRFDDDGKIVEISILRDDLGILTDQGYANFLVVVIFALGGALGMSLMWVLIRRTRRHAA